MFMWRSMSKSVPIGQLTDGDRVLAINRHDRSIDISHTLDMARVEVSRRSLLVNQANAETWLGDD